MCAWGTDIAVECLAGFNGTNKARTLVAVDACLADIVAALNSSGLLTRDCCCGHGKEPGQIRLMDGRTLTVGTGV